MVVYKGQMKPESWVYFICGTKSWSDKWRCLTCRQILHLDLSQWDLQSALWNLSGEETKTMLKYVYYSVVIYGHFFKSSSHPAIVVGRGMMILSCLSCDRRCSTHPNARRKRTPANAGSSTNNSQKASRRLGIKMNKRACCKAQSEPSMEGPPISEQLHKQTV